MLELRGRRRDVLDIIITIIVIIGIFVLIGYIAWIVAEGY